MKKLLIVEDDKNWADILCSYAAAVGADTRVVVSGGQAMEIIAVALLNELRSHADLARLPVVVCSNVDVNLEDLRPFGVRALLDKASMRPDEVRAIFREVLDGAK